jgi:DNA-binding NtrC family response regulator
MGMSHGFPGSIGRLKAVAQALDAVGVIQMKKRQMTGLELLERVRSSQPEVPVIIITGKPSYKSEAFYLDKGANGFFRKPIDGQALMALIDLLLT